MKNKYPAWGVQQRTILLPVKLYFQRTKMTCQIDLNIIIAINSLTGMRPSSGMASIIDQYLFSLFCFLCIIVPTCYVNLKKKNTKQKLGILWALEIINTLKIHESNALVLQLQRIWFALQKFHINRTLICHRERN